MSKTLKKKYLELTYFDVHSRNKAHLPFVVCSSMHLDTEGVSFLIIVRDFPHS